MGIVNGRIRRPLDEEVGPPEGDIGVPVEQVTGFDGLRIALAVFVDDIEDVVAVNDGAAGC